MHPISLLALLADGRFHSGQGLAHELGISRAAVWKLIQDLKALGLTVHAVSGKGYRLPDPPELLDVALIRDGLTPAVDRALGRLDVLPQIDSTNRFLLKRHDVPTQRLAVVLAESQTAGRGRRGKQWVSPFGRHIALSLLYPNFAPQQAVEGLSLAAALAVTRCLLRAGVQGAGIKWPNDILCGGKKLAGILVELAGESGGQYRLVVGVGINLSMPAELAQTIDQPWTDLASQGASSVSRNHLAAELINELVAVVDQFQQHGLTPFLAEWGRHDLLHRRPVSVSTPSGQVVGTALGIDDQGALLVDTGGQTRRFFSGEVSVRSSTAESPVAQH